MQRQVHDGNALRCAAEGISICTAEGGANRLL